MYYINNCTGVIKDNTSSYDIAFRIVGCFLMCTTFMLAIVLYKHNKSYKEYRELLKENENSVENGSTTELLSVSHRDEEEKVNYKYINYIVHNHIK